MVTKSTENRDTPAEGRKQKSTHFTSRQSLPGPSWSLACQSNSKLLNFTLNWRHWSLSQSLRDFRCNAKAKVHNEWKAPSQIDFKLNQTLVFNYLPDLLLRNFKTCTKRGRERESEEGKRRRSEQNANDSNPAWCQNRWPSGSAGADEWAVEVEPIATSS